MSYFINAITQHYADFSGRARRKEFWMFMLFGTVFLVVAMILDKVLRTTISMEIMDESIDTGHGWVYLLSCIGIILPSLAVGVRRLHDVGKSGWFFLVNLIPFAGGIWCLGGSVHGQPAWHESVWSEPQRHWRCDWQLGRSREFFARSAAHFAYMVRHSVRVMGILHRQSISSGHFL